jgi:hypothetical protein
MNKLEEYRDKEAKEERKNTYINEKDREKGFKAGFDAVIALDLPVKFAEWLRKDWNYVKGKYRHKGDFYKNYNLQTEKELYQYWIENIYKPE